MPHIVPMRPDQTAEARRVIYQVAFQIFGGHNTFEEAAAHYALAWPIHDVDEYQSAYVENGGTFLVCLDNERIIGTGALHRLEDQVGEIKRLWLLPAYQGQGIGYQMLQALLHTARQMGYTKVRLETSPAYQQRAFAFYLQAGFVEIPRYGDDPDDVGMELDLT